MPFTLSWEPKGVHCQGHGRCSIKDLLDAFEAIGADRRFDYLRYVIFDYTDVTAHDVTAEEIELAAGIDFAQRMTNPRLVTASVSRDESIRTLWRHFSSVFKRKNSAMCDTVHEARDWIRAQDRP